MKKPWWLKIPERLSRLAFAFVLMRDKSVIMKCQYCGSWKLKVIMSTEYENDYKAGILCENCKATCSVDEHWTKSVIIGG